MRRIQYSFTMPDGVKEEFDLHLDDETSTLIDLDLADPPFWTRLDYSQCPHCPLTAAAHPHCPLALVLVGIVERFNDIISYDDVHVEVVSDDRFSSLDTSAQKAVGSFVGLAMATSGCPHTAFFKPMARFHLCFSNEAETVYRAASMYLLAQYFRRQDGHAADLDLAGLKDIYHNIHAVNVSISQRLREASETDAVVNGIVVLDMYSFLLPLSIEQSLDQVRHLFTRFLDGGAPVRHNQAEV